MGLALEVRPIFQKKLLGERVVNQSLQRSNTGGPSPAYPSAIFIRWTATVDYSAQKWTSLNHDTCWNVEGSLSFGVFPPTAR